jgi:hypothetical protein
VQRIDSKYHHHQRTILIASTMFGVVATTVMAMMAQFSSALSVTHTLSHTEQTKLIPVGCTWKVDNVVWLYSTVGMVGNKNTNSTNRIATTTQQQQHTGSTMAPKQMAFEYHLGGSEYSNGVISSIAISS